MEIPELSSSLRNAISILNKRLRKPVYCGPGFSITELNTISYLYQSPPLSPSALAELNKIKTQSMSQVLGKLEKEKIIRRTASREDKRKVSVSLTAQGEKIVEQSRYERDGWLAEAIKAMLSDKEVKTLSAVIPILQKIANVD